MASLKRKCLNSAADERTANTVESLRADGSSRVQVGNSYTEVHNYEGHRADDECLRDLRTTDPRIDKTRIEKDKGGLVQGSYHWVLENSNFQQWGQGTNDRLLWVKGDPGKGKTMLLCGLIDELKKSQHTLSYFFCQATDSRINNATSVLRGLIYLLVVQDTSLTRHVRNKWDHGGKSTFDPPNGWHALCNILDDILHDHSKPTCLVIDALDECEGGSLSSLLNLIVSTASKFHHIKWLVSSRNLPDIERGLGGANVGGRLDISLEANAGHVSKAVADYIDYKIDSLAKLSSELDLRNKVKETMQHKANGTFLWAALAFGELKTEEDEELEDNSEMLDILNQVPEGLTNLYARMWRQISTQGSRNSSSCMVILATMFLAYRPLQLQELPLLAGFKGNLAAHDTLMRLVRRCGSFLAIQQDAETIHFVHQSAKDYLTDNKHALNRMFPSGIGEGHRRLFSCSLAAMNSPNTGLRKDIYGLRNLGVLTSDIKTPVSGPLAPMRYSYLRWIDHFYQWVSSKQDRNQNDANDVATFLQDKYLYWLEALGLCGDVPEGIVSIRKLEALARQYKWEHLTTMVRDAHRFVLANRQGIETAPLQVYVSALVFCPTSSWVRNTFKAMIPKWITKEPAMPPEWDACWLTLEGHRAAVDQLAFAPNNKIMASGDFDGIIKIWDLYTGACLHTISTRGHHPFGISLLALLAREDSVILVSAGSKPDNSGYLIKIWDPSSGFEPQTTLSVHHRASHVLWLIANGETLVSADKTGKLMKWDLWDLNSGSPLSTIQLRHMPLAVSPDGQTIVTYAEEDNLLETWDWHGLPTSQLPLDRDLDLDCRVAFSPDSTKLVCTHEDGSVDLWDLVTDPCTHRASHAHVHKRVLCTEFSPDGTVVITGNAFGEVGVWNTTKNELQALSGHSESIRAVGISPDGKLIASGSNDSTMKIWDPTTGSTTQHLEKDLRHATRELILSPDGLHIVSRAESRLVRVWSSAVSECAGKRLHHTPELRSMGFSPDSQWLVLVPKYSPIQVWNATTWKHQFDIPKNPRYAGLVRFYSTTRGTKLASVSSSHATIDIWDPDTANHESSLSTHLSCIKKILFSSDGSLLASASAEGVEVWDWAAHECIWALKSSNVDIRWHKASNEFLCTSCGNFDVRKSTGNPPIDPADLPSEEDEAAAPQVQLTQDNEWITFQGNCLLWLPPQHRPRYSEGGRVVACNQSGIAMADGSNRMISFQLDVRQITRDLQT